MRDDGEWRYEHKTTSPVMALRQRKPLSSYEPLDQRAENRILQQHGKKPSKLKVWLLASRPHTLTASITPVIVATSLVKVLGGETAADINHDSVIFAAFACFIQLGTNLHNDYADFVKGADDDTRGKCFGILQAKSLYLHFLMRCVTSYIPFFCKQLDKLGRLKKDG